MMDKVHTVFSYDSMKDNNDRLFIFAGILQVKRKQLSINLTYTYMTYIGLLFFGVHMLHPYTSQALGAESISGLKDLKDGLFYPRKTKTKKHARKHNIKC